MRLRPRYAHPVTLASIAVRLPSVRDAVVRVVRIERLAAFGAATERVTGGRRGLACAASHRLEVLVQLRIAELRPNKRLAITQHSP